MELFADDIIESALRVSQVELDYSPESIEGVDAILQGFLNDGVSEWQIAETLVGFGAYVGEVIIRNHGGRWKDITGDQLASVLGPLPMVVEMPSGTIWNPIGKCFKRVSDETDNLPFFYQGVVENAT